MAALVNIRLYFVVATIFCTFLTARIVAQGDDYVPEIGPLGKHPDVGHPDVKEPDHGDLGHVEEDTDPGVGIIGNDPAHIAAQALLCFNEKHIYSECQESHRLTETGELHVPSDHIHEFCAGPCLEETNLVLHCLDGIMDHFLFFNKVTTQDVKDTILAACSHGGDLDVPEHLEAARGGESIGSKATICALFGMATTILGQIYLM